MQFEFFRRKVSFIPQSPAVEQMLTEMCQFVYEWQVTNGAEHFSLKRSGDGFVVEVVVHGQLEANAGVLVNIIESIPLDQRNAVPSLNVYLEKVKRYARASGRHMSSEPSKYFEIHISQGEKWVQFCESFVAWVEKNTPSALSLCVSWNRD